MAADPKRRSAGSAADVGWAVVSTLVGGIAVWGLLGYLADRWLGTAHVFFTIGVLLGAGGAIYLVWLRYGKE